MVYFNTQNGSIDKFIYRSVLPNFETNDMKTLCDTLFVIHPFKKISETYYGNSIINTDYQAKVLKEEEYYIYNAKKATEDKFKSR